MISSISQMLPKAWRPKTSKSEAAAPQPQASPTDEVNLSGTRSPSRGLAMAGRYLCAALAFSMVAGLAGCGHNLDPAELGKPVPVQTAAQDRAQSLHFEVIPNAVAKVDVIRQTHTEAYDCGTTEKPRTCFHEVPDPLQPVGIYLGNGLFLDAGLNLSMVPDRAFHGPVIPQDFQRLEIKGALGDWSKSTVTQNGNEVGISKALTFFDHHVVRKDDDHVSLKLGTFSALQKFKTIEVSRQGNQIEIQGWTLPGFEALSRVRITQNGDTTEVHPFGIAAFVNTDITRTGEQIKIQPFGGGFSRTLVERRADGTIHIRNPLGVSGTNINRGDKGINVSSTGMGIGKSSILEQTPGNFLIRQPGVWSTTTIVVQK